MGKNNQQAAETPVEKTVIPEVPEVPEVPEEEAAEIDETNPFNKGVTYPMFLKAIGKKSVKEALSGKFSEDQITWIENEIQDYKNNLKK